MTEYHILTTCQFGQGRINNVETKKKYLYIACGVLIVLASYLLCSKLQNTGDGIDETRTNIQSAGKQLEAAGAGVEKAKDTAANIEQSVDTSRELNTSNSELIAEGKRILATIRARGQKN